MEALLEREADVENWNDERLDELSGRMDEGFKETREGFARIDRKFEQVPTREEMNRCFRDVDQRFDKVDREGARVNDRLDKLFYGVTFLSLALGLNLLADKV